MNFLELDNDGDKDLQLKHTSGVRIFTFRLRLLENQLLIRKERASVKATSWPAPTRKQNFR